MVVVVMFELMDVNGHCTSCCASAGVVAIVRTRRGPRRFFI